MHLSYFSLRPLRQHALWLTASLFLFSCSDDDVSPSVPPSSLNGYFIVNEGAFQGGNTSLSYYDRASDSVLNNVFETANGSKLGDQSQSMTVIGDRGFVVVQNSAKIEVIDRSDFTSVATITEGIVSPRYLIGVDDTKAYVTDWGEDGITGTVKVIDLASYQVTASIPVGEGPNQLLSSDGRVYVANGGAFGHDSTVMVLDPQADAVVDTIIVGDNPSSLAIDVNGALWIAGGGLVRYTDDFSAIMEEESTPGFLAVIENDQVSRRFEAAQINVGPSSLTTNIARTDLYFHYRGGVHTITSDATTLPETPLIDADFLGLAVDPVTDEILVGDRNYSSEGRFYRYAPTGELINSYTVGIAPNGFAF